MTVDLPSKFDLFIGEHCGMIKYVNKRSFPKGIPEVNETRPIAPYVNEIALSKLGDDLSAAGKGISVEESLKKSVGEVIERYSMCQGNQFSSETYSYDEARRKGKAVDSKYLDPFRALRSDEVVIPIEELTSIRWICGTDLLQDEDVWFPKAKAFFLDESTEGCKPNHQHEDTVGRTFITTSSGWATAWTPEVAIRRGIYEIIERDAFLSAWYAQSSGTKISFEDESAISHIIADVLGQSSMEPEFFKLDSCVSVPVIYCLLKNKTDGYPGAVFGMSAGASHQDAMIEALCEAGQSWNAMDSYRRNQLDLDPDTIIDFDPLERTNPADNMMYYCHPQNASKLEFVEEGGTRALNMFADLDSQVPRSCRELLQALDETGFSVHAFDMTPRELAPTGVTVMKTYIPELLPFCSCRFVPSRHPRFSDDMSESVHPFV